VSGAGSAGTRSDSALESVDVFGDFFGGVADFREGSVSSKEIPSERNSVSGPCRSSPSEAGLRTEKRARDWLQFLKSAESRSWRKFH
jgi:hypothetical protein